MENENAELKSSLARCQFPQQQHETESLVAENELLKREKSEAEAKVRGLAENNSNLVQELEARKYETVQLKRDAECYSRYFAQIDNEYEGLRAHIRRLEGAQEEVAAEKDVIVIEDDDDEDDEDFQDAEDIQDEFDDDGNLAYDEMDEYFGVIPSNRQ